MNFLRKLAHRRAKRREAQRKCAIMLDMMRELNAMAGHAPPVYWDTREHGPGWDLPGHPDQYREPEPYDPQADGGIPITGEPESAQSVNSSAYWGARAAGHGRDEAEAIAARAGRDWPRGGLLAPEGER